MPSRRAASPLQLKKPALGWPAFLFRQKEPKHVVFDLPMDPLLRSPKQRALPAARGLESGRDLFPAPDYTALLSDELLRRILSLLPPPAVDSACLVSRRWLRIFGENRRSLTLLDWSFLDPPSRIVSRFPALAEVDLVPASFSAPVLPSGMILTSGSFSVPLEIDFEASGAMSQFLPTETVDRGLEILARSFPNLRKLALVAVASELVLMKVADECPTLQELELHRCTDFSLRAISAFSNLQILKLVGSVEGLYGGPGVSDIGLTILAHGCKRLVKLELSRCGGGYDGISAIGRCCLMLEELSIHGHRMSGGWMGGLPSCGNLKTLRLEGCRRIDEDPRINGGLSGSCPAIERLHLQRCQLRDKKSLCSLLVLCQNAREIILQDCWGLDDDMFSATAICRRVKRLAVEGCSLLSTTGLESAVLQWPDLERLRVVSCNKIRDEEITPALSNLFALLKELQWRPDSRSALAQILAGTGMGRKGGRLFRWT